MILDYKYIDNPSHILDDSLMTASVEFICFGEKKTDNGVKKTFQL